MAKDRNTVENSESAVATSPAGKLTRAEAKAAFQAAVSAVRQIDHQISATAGDKATVDKLRAKRAEAEAAAQAAKVVLDGCK